jgi:hypothetical protein
MNKKLKKQLMIISKTILRAACIFVPLLCPALAFSQNKKADLSNRTPLPNPFVKSAEFEISNPTFTGKLVYDSVYKPVLSHQRAQDGFERESDKLEEIRNEKALLKGAFEKEGYSTLSEETEKAMFTPQLGPNFIGNLNNGFTPMDNSIAVSDNGVIVSVSNTLIEMYSATGQLLYSNTIDVFFNDPTISIVCDPVVVFDSGVNKFIFFAQECAGESYNSHLLICFSTSNDPVNGGWYNYKLSGDPFSQNNWFDYPKMAVSTNELYITGNLFDNSDVFNQSAIFQIEKNNGFVGGSLTSQVWYGSALTGTPSTLLPVSYGQQGNYGPGCYLVATNSGGDNKIMLYDLTDDMSSASEIINSYEFYCNPYSISAPGLQQGTTYKLDNGDCRALSGFYLNGKIHFVFHSDIGNGYNGINYNRLDLNAWSLQNATYGASGYEYSYPSVASFATSATDNTVVIGYLRTGSSIKPQIRAVSCNSGMTWVSSILVKSGVSFNNHLPNANNVCRWGDYTGITRLHNSSTPVLWMNGMFANNNHEWDTWIAQINTTGNTSVEDLSVQSDVLVYPNPSSAKFSIDFFCRNSGNLKLNLISSTGQTVKILIDRNTSSGMKNFSFDTTNLERGIYFLRIELNGKLLQTEKIIVE